MSGLFSESELGNTGLNVEVQSNEGDNTQASSEAAQEETQSQANVESVATETKPETQVEGKAPEQEWSLIPEKFNQIIGGEFQDVDSIKNYFTTAKETATKYEELESKHKEAQIASAETELRLKSLAEAINTKSLYADDSISKLNTLVTKYPSVDKSMLLKVLETDISSMSDFDTAIMQKQFELGVDTDVARILVEKDAGITDAEEFTPQDKAVLKAMAIKAKKQFSEIQKVEATQVADLEKIFSEARSKTDGLQKDMTEKWKPAMESINKLDNVSLKVKDYEGNDIDFTFSFDDRSKALTDTDLQAFVKSGVQPTPENIKLVNDSKEAFAVRNNLSKIMNTHTSNELTKAKLKWQSEVHNDESFNTQTRTNITQSEVDEASNRLSKALTRNGSSLF